MAKNQGEIEIKAKDEITPIIKKLVENMVSIKNLLNENAGLMEKFIPNIIEIKTNEK